MHDDRFAEIAGARIRYRVEGRGPAVVLIHGLGAFLESWEWTVPALRDRYTTVTFDFPGFGLSEPVGDAFRPDGAAAFVLKLMDALEVRRAILVGSSLGGGIAVLAAGAAPDRCAGLVLAAPAGFGPDTTPATRLATLPVVGEILIHVVRRAPGVGVRRALNIAGPLPPGLVEAARRAFHEGVAAASCLRILRATADVRGVRPEVTGAIRAAAARTTAPALILWGSRDRIVPTAYAEIAAAAFPNAEVRLFPGAGHVPFIEEAEAFNAVLLEFLDRIDRPASVAARS